MNVALRTMFLTSAIWLAGCPSTQVKPDCPPPVVLHEAQPCVCPEPEAREPWPELRAPVLSPAVFFVGGPVAVGGVLALGRRRLGSGSDPTGPVAPLPGSLALIDMEALLDGRVDGIDAVRLFTGYSGWAAGQLDAEIAAGAWHVVTALPDDVLCGDPGSLWRSVMRRQGGRTAAQGLFPEDPSVN